MKFIGYLFTLLGFAMMATGFFCRVYPDLLQRMPLENMTSSSFTHTGQGCFIIAITMFMIHIVNQRY